MLGFYEKKNWKKQMVSKLKTEQVLQISMKKSKMARNWNEKAWNPS